MFVCRLIYRNNRMAKLHKKTIPAAMAWSSYDNNIMLYFPLVLKKTSCFHITGHIHITNDNRSKVWLRDIITHATVPLTWTHRKAKDANPDSSDPGSVLAHISSVKLKLRRWLAVLLNKSLKQWSCHSPVTLGRHQFGKSFQRLLWTIFLQTTNSR